MKRDPFSPPFFLENLLMPSPSHELPALPWELTIRWYQSHAAPPVSVDTVVWLPVPRRLSNADADD